MRPTVMIMFGYIMLVLNLLLAVGSWFLQADPNFREYGPKPVMFLAGSCVWIVGLLIWHRIKEQEDEDR